MRFWDSSAIVPLCIDEARTAELRALAIEDAGIAVWWLTRTECLSAVSRRLREGELAVTDEHAARTVLRALEHAWSEVQPTDRVRNAADRMLVVHELRTADALQLAAALDWCDGRTDGAAVVCLDRRLRLAAHREGFLVLPERE